MTGFEEEGVYLPWDLEVQEVLAGWASHHPPEETTAEAEGIPCGHLSGPAGPNLP